MSQDPTGGSQYWALVEQGLIEDPRTSEGPQSAVDIVSAVLQATTDLATGAVIVDLIAAARESAGMSSLPDDYTGETEVGEYGEGGNRPVGGGRIRRATPIMGEVIPTVRSASMPMLDEELLRSKLEPQIIAHIGATIAIGIASVIGTLIPFINLDRVLEAIHSMYALLDTPVIFSQVRDERLAVEWRRPFRYWIESQLQNNIPPTADLITFLVREQITLDEFKRAMTYWGYSEDVADAYWGAHWVMPTTEQIFDLLALGFINDDEAKQQLIINDIAPEWIDRIFELRVRLPSRTELRMIMRRMKLPSELVRRVFDFERLHPDYAEYYEAMLVNWDMDSINGKIVTEALGQYADGLLTEEALRVILTDSLQSPLETDRNVELANLRLIGDRAESIKKRYVILYKKGYIGRDVASAQISELGFNPIDVDIWLDNAEVDQLPKIDIPTHELESKEESPETPDE